MALGGKSTAVPIQRAAIGKSIVWPEIAIEWVILIGIACMIVGIWAGVTLMCMMRMASKDDDRAGRD